MGPEQANVRPRNAQANSAVGEWEKALSPRREDPAPARHDGLLPRSAEEEKLDQVGDAPSKRAGPEPAAEVSEASEATEESEFGHQEDSAWRHEALGGEIARQLHLARIVST